MADDQPSTLLPTTQNETLTLENQTSEFNNSENDDGEEEEEEEEVIEQLEMEVKQMAESILHFRETLPNQLNKTFSSYLVSQRPPTSPFLLTPGQDLEDILSLGKGALLAEEDPEMAKKIGLLKLKISSNVSAMPAVLKRMNDCISMIEKLDATDDSTIFPPFKRKMR